MRINLKKRISTELNHVILANTLERTGKVLLAISQTPELMDRRKYLSTLGLSVTGFAAGCSSSGPETVSETETSSVVSKLADEQDISPGLYEVDFAIENGEGLSFNLSEVEEKYQPVAYSLYERGDPSQMYVADIGETVNKRLGGKVERGYPTGEYTFTAVFSGVPETPEWLSDLYVGIEDMQFSVKKVSGQSNYGETKTQLMDFWTDDSVTFEAIQNEVQKEYESDLDKLENIKDNPEKISAMLARGATAQASSHLLSIYLLNKFNELSSDEKKDLTEMYREILITKRIALVYNIVYYWLQDKVKTTQTVASFLIAEVIQYKLGLEEEVTDDIQKEVKKYLSENTGAFARMPQNPKSERFSLPITIYGDISTPWTDSDARISFEVPIEIIVNAPYEVPLKPTHTAEIVDVSVFREDTSVHVT